MFSFVAVGSRAIKVGLNRRGVSLVSLVTCVRPFTTTRLVCTIDQASHRRQHDHRSNMPLSLIVTVTAAVIGVAALYGLRMWIKGEIFV